METHTTTHGHWTWVLLAAATGLVTIAGCSSTPTQAEQDLAAREALCRQKIRLTTQAVQAGDIATAKAELAVARNNQVTFAQERQVQSLTELIAGAEALYDGDAATAVAHWSRIDDPQLNREVRAKAKRIGLDVPLAPQNTQTADAGR